jgi:hypothetical protein
MATVRTPIHVSLAEPTDRELGMRAAALEVAEFRPQRRDPLLMLQRRDLQLVDDLLRAI